MSTIIGWSRPPWVTRANGEATTLLRGEAVIEAGGGAVLRATHANVGAWPLGVVAGDAAAGQSVVVYLAGDVKVRVTSLPAVGARLWLSSTAGLMTPSPGGSDPLVEIGTVTTTGGYTVEAPLVNAYVHKIPRTS